MRIKVIFLQASARAGNLCMQVQYTEQVKGQDTHSNCVYNSFG